MADMWDWLVPNISGQTNEKVAGARAQNAGPNGRLDPNAITRDTLSGYGIPSDVTDEAAPYLGTYRMNNDIAKSALTPPEEPWNQTLGRWLQVPAIGLMTHEGNRAAGPLLGDNLNTQAISRKHKYQDAERENVLKNAQSLTSNVDSVIAEQQKNRTALRARKEAQTARENEAARYGLKEGTPEFNRYVLEGKYEPQYGATDDLKEYNAAKQQGYQGSVTDFLQMKKSGTISPYKQNPDGTQTFVKGGSADPEVVSKLSEARGRGGMNVPQAVRTAGIQANQAYQNLVPALDDYAKLVNKTGAVWSPGADKDSVIRARRGIQLQLKELFNLGVLNGPDLSLMDSMLFDPSVSLNPFSDEGSVTNAYDTAGRAQKSVNDLKEMLRGIRNNKTKILGLPDIGPDGKEMAGAPIDRTSLGAGPMTDEGQPDYAGMSNEELKAQLGIQ